MTQPQITPKQRFAQFGVIRAMAVFVNLWLALFALFAHLWTPKGNSVDLFTGVGVAHAVPAVLILPLINIVAIVFISQAEFYREKRVKVGLLLLSVVYFVTFYGLNAIFMNTDEKSPGLSFLAGTGIIFLPLLLVIFSGLALRRPKTVGERVVAGVVIPPPTLGRANHSGRNPFLALPQAFRALKLNAKVVATVLGIGTFLSVLPTLVQQAIPLPHTSVVTLVILGATFLLLPFMFIITSMMMVLAVATVHQRQISFKETLKTGLHFVFPFLGLSILSSLIIGAGFMLLVIPGIIAVFRLILAPYIMFDRGIDPVEAMKLSNQLMKRSTSQIIGISVVLGTINIIFMVMTVIWPLTGAIIGTAVIMVMSLLSHIYFIWLYQDILAVKEAGYVGLQAGLVNVLLGISTILILPAIVIAGIAGLVVLSQQTQTHSTACYEIKASKAYVFDDKGSCHVVAQTHLSILEYRPLTDSAANSADLADHQLSQIFPANKYKVSVSPDPNTNRVDGVPAMIYSLDDLNQPGSTVTAVFVHSQEPYAIGSDKIQNFVLIQTPNPDAGTTTPSVTEFSALFTTVEDTLVWNAPDTAH